MHKNNRISPSFSSHITTNARTYTPAQIHIDNNNINCNPTLTQHHNNSESKLTRLAGASIRAVGGQWPKQPQKKEAKNRWSARDTRLTDEFCFHPQLTYFLWPILCRKTFTAHIYASHRRSSFVAFLLLLLAKRCSLNGAGVNGKFACTYVFPNVCFTRIQYVGSMGAVQFIHIK